ncbi:MAG: hypothetical protein IPG71_05875 [bacterium]|nr:hypothetical protein [bacterium]
MKIRISSAFLLLAVLFVAGCDVSDPGSPIANRPPTTVITSAPRNGSMVNHYLTLRWSGNDGDGVIAGFNMYIDGQMAAFTLRTDSSISFASPATGESVSHTFRIQAVDDDGEVDSNAPEIQFYTRNEAPTCFFSSDNIVAPNANVARGFKLKLEANDPNRSGVWFTMSVDDTVNWSDWSRDSVFMFADLSLGDFPAGVNTLSNEELTEGLHTIYARCKDSGSAISPVVSRAVNVGLNRVPVMGETTVRYNHGTASDSLYKDGSVYRVNNAQLTIAFEATAFAYRGVIHSFRYRQDEGEWSQWMLLPELGFTDLPTGSYSFDFQARDVAGSLSHTSSYFVNLVTQQLSDSVIVVDETRNGNGTLTSPSDAQVDTFYSSVLNGYRFRQIDMSARSPGAYVSPYDLQNIGVIIWHADDRSEQMLDNQTRILVEFLRRGGRVVFSGWDIMNAFSVDDATQLYTDSDFESRYLRAFEAKRDPSNNWLAVQQGTGTIGENGFPSLTIDQSKILSNWQGALPRTWVFDQHGECTVIGRLTTRDPDYFQNGLVAAYLYDVTFRVAVFGVPLYYCMQPQVADMFGTLMPVMLYGL